MTVEQWNKLVDAINDDHKKMAMKIIVEGVAMDTMTRTAVLGEEQLKKELAEAKEEVAELKNNLVEISLAWADINKRCDELFKRSDEHGSVIKTLYENSSGKSRMDTKKTFKAERICPACGKPIKGRGKKIFCDECKKKNEASGVTALANELAEMENPK